MAANFGAGISGAAQGASAGSAFGGYGAMAGAVLGGLGGLFGGGSSAKDTAKQQMKYYARYILPRLQEQQNKQQFLNTQALGTYTGQGNEAMRALTSLGTGQFGLSELDQDRLTELQGRQAELQNTIANGTPEQRLQAQADMQELSSLMAGQSQGAMFGGSGSGGGLGNFLTSHPLFQAQQQLMQDQIQQQYGAAFGGVAPSSFLAKAQGSANNQALLDTYGNVTNTLGTAAGLGGSALGQQTGLNTGLTQSTMNSLGSFGNVNAMGSAQAGEGAWGNSLLQGLSALGEAYDPLNRQARSYASQWLQNKMGGGLQAPSLGGYGKPIGGFVNPYTGAQQGGL